MSDLTVYVERSEDRAVVTRVFCSRECAAESGDPPEKLEATRVPTNVAGITGYAVHLICCHSCGDNLMDVVCRR